MDLNNENHKKHTSTSMANEPERKKVSITSGVARTYELALAEYRLTTQLSGIPPITARAVAAGPSGLEALPNAASVTSATIGAADSLEMGRQRSVSPPLVPSCHCETVGIINDHGTHVVYFKHRIMWCDAQVNKRWKDYRTMFTHPYLDDISEAVV